MTQAAVQAGWLDKQTVVIESMMAFKRAGAMQFDLFCPLYRRLPEPEINRLIFLK